MKKYLTLKKYNLEHCVYFADKYLKDVNLPENDRLYLLDVKTDSELLIKIVDVLLNSDKPMNQLLDKFGLSFSRLSLALSSSTFKFTKQELRKINGILNN